MFECCEKKQARTSKMSFSQLKLPNKKTWKNMILALFFVTTLVYLAFNKIGIIGCGHLGTMILTKLLEIQGSFNNLQLFVSTRQPHLLRPFQQEFGVTAEFNNERIVRECDIIFLCVLPSQIGLLLEGICCKKCDIYTECSVP